MLINNNIYIICSVSADEVFDCGFLAVHEDTYTIDFGGYPCHAHKKRCKV